MLHKPFKISFPASQSIKLSNESHTANVTELLPLAYYCLQGYSWSASILPTEQRFFKKEQEVSAFFHLDLFLLTVKVHTEFGKMACKYTAPWMH